jgi:hypothetical protein
LSAETPHNAQIIRHQENFSGQATFLVVADVALQADVKDPDRAVGPLLRQYIRTVTS